MQRWVYFAHNLKRLGWHPIVVTVDPKEASYPKTDRTLQQLVEGIEVVHTSTREPLKAYARWVAREKEQAVPQGDVPRGGVLQKIAAFVRGNFFIPDARKGWVPFAVDATRQVLKAHKADFLITTGPPHSTHLAGEQLKKRFPNLQWWVDFRDPWTTVFYNQLFYRTTLAKKRDATLEKRIIQGCTGAIVTIDGKLSRYLQTLRTSIPIVVLPNGFDKELIQNTPKNPPSDFFHIVYTGLLTTQQDYRVFLHLLQECQSKRPIRFSLAGQITPSILEEIKKELPHVEVIYHGYISQQKAVKLMKTGHLLVNFFFKGAEQTMLSGKLLSYLATTVPVISLGDPNSAAGLLMQKSTCARLFSSQQHQEAIAFIQSLMDSPNAINHFPKIEHWSRKSITQRLIDEVLEQSNAIL